MQANDLLWQDRDAFVCAALAAVGEEAVAQAISPAGGAGSWQMAPAFVAGLESWAAVQLCPAVGEKQGLREAFASRPALLRLVDLRPALYSYPYRGESLGQTEREGLAFAALID